jgi:hypothetical protein
VSRFIQGFIERNMPRRGYVKPWYQHVAVAVSSVLLAGYTLTIFGFLIADLVIYGAPTGYVEPLQFKLLLTWIPVGVVVGDVLYIADREINGSDVLQLTPAMQAAATEAEQ